MLSVTGPVTTVVVVGVTVVGVGCVVVGADVEEAGVVGCVAAGGGAVCATGPVVGGVVAPELVGGTVSKLVIAVGWVVVT